MKTLPTFADVMAIEASLRDTVPAEHVDGNGHMNIRHYMGAASRTMLKFWSDAGYGPGTLLERGFSAFTAEQHLTYHGELLEGDAFSTHARVLDRSDSVVHIMVLLLDQSRERLSFTYEVLGIAIDMNTRKSGTFPEDVREMLDRRIGKHRALGWDAPVCGAMGVRRA